MILILLLLNFAQAENWMRVEDIKAGLVRGYALRESCEKGTSEEYVEIVSECNVGTESAPKMEECVLKVPKYIRQVPCPTAKDPERLCPVNIACVEIGNISPNVIGVDESKTPPVAVVDPAKKSAQDAIDATKQAEINRQRAAETALKNLPANIPSQGLSGAIHNLMEYMGIK